MQSNLKLLNIFVRIDHKRNDPNFKPKRDTSHLQEILDILKERHKRTVLRKIDDGVNVHFDEKIGVIDKDTEEVIIDIKNIYYDGNQEEDDDSEDEKEEGKKIENIKTEKNKINIEAEDEEEEDFDEEDEEEENINSKIKKK